jgi:hypothetical protein
VKRIHRSGFVETLNYDKYLETKNEEEENGAEGEVNIKIIEKDNSPHLSSKKELKALSNTEDVSYNPTSQTQFQYFLNITSF